MQETLFIAYQGSAHRLTIGDLEQLKLDLIEALKQEQSPEAYGHLIEELEMYSHPIITDNSAFIGRWQLKMEWESVWLERQQMPRAPVMLFHLAELEFTRGQWQVKKVTNKKVWRTP